MQITTLSKEFTESLNSQEWRDDSADELGAPPKKKPKDSVETISSESEETVSWEIPNSVLFPDEC